VDSVRSAKAATNEAAAAAQKVVLSQPFGVSQSQARDADVRALADLSRALDKKVITHPAVYLGSQRPFGSS
jgi:hypothetical protein